MQSNSSFYNDKLKKEYVLTRYICNGRATFDCHISETKGFYHFWNISIGPFKIYSHKIKGSSHDQMAFENGVTRFSYDITMPPLAL